MVNWAGLFEVLVFALVTGAVLVSAFSFGLINLDRYALSRSDSGATALGALIFAALCFAVCVVGVGLGLWAMVHK